VQVATEDDGQPDASADPQQHHVVDVLSGAFGPFGGRGQIDIVLEGHLAAEIRCQSGAESAVPAREVERELNVTAARIDHSGHPDDDVVNSGDIDVACLGRIDGDVVDELIRVGRFGDRALRACDNGARDIGKRGPDPVRVEFDADAVGAPWPHGVKLSIRPAAGGLGSDHFYQVPLLQAGQQL
jgi:hypothetical protein